MNQLDLFQKFSLLKQTPTTASDRTIEAYRMPTVYHNTTELKGEELDAAQTRASRQTEIILKVFQDHPHTSFTPWDLYYHFGQQMMITSIRRAITTLTNSSPPYLVKTAERRKSGPANETSYCWKLNR